MKNKGIKKNTSSIFNQKKTEHEPGSGNTRTLIGFLNVKKMKASLFPTDLQNRIHHMKKKRFKKIICPFFLFNIRYINFF